MHSKSTIISQLQCHDHRVMQTLYDDYAPALYGVIFRIVKSEELAEDVLQDTFVKIWKNGPDYDASKGSLFTWMLNIARNTAIDLIRSAHHRRRQHMESPDQAAHIGESFNVNHIGVNAIVDNLDEKYRKVIDLIYFQGYTHKEVVEELDIPLGTVKSRIRIALRELRKLFISHVVSLIGFTLILVKYFSPLG